MKESSSKIVDPVGKKKGHQSIECNGPCHMWLHRQCAGLSRAAFDAAGASNDPFFCPQCVISNQNQEITTLKLKLDEVLNELSALKNEVADLKKEVSQHLVQDDNNPDSIPLGLKRMVFFTIRIIGMLNKRISE